MASLRLLRAFAAGAVYYDPGIKLENASTEKAKSKKRSQFRVASKYLGALYETVEMGGVNGARLCEAQPVGRGETARGTWLARTLAPPDIAEVLRVADPRSGATGARGRIRGGGCGLFPFIRHPGLLALAFSVLVC